MSVDLLYKHSISNNWIWTQNSSIRAQKKFWELCFICNNMIWTKDSMSKIQYLSDWAIQGKFKFRALTFSVFNSNVKTVGFEPWLSSIKENELSSEPHNLYIHCFVLAFVILALSAFTLKCSSNYYMKNFIVSSVWKLY